MQICLFNSSSTINNHNPKKMNNKFLPAQMNYFSQSSNIIPLSNVQLEEKVQSNQQMNSSSKFSDNINSDDFKNLPNDNDSQISQKTQNLSHTSNSQFKHRLSANSIQNNELSFNCENNISNDRHDYQINNNKHILNQSNKNVNNKNFTIEANRNMIRNLLGIEGKIEFSPDDKQCVKQENPQDVKKELNQCQTKSYDEKQKLELQLNQNIQLNKNHLEINQIKEEFNDTKNNKEKESKINNNNFLNKNNEYNLKCLNNCIEWKLTITQDNGTIIKIVKFNRIQLLSFCSKNAMKT